jgi:hypothetical protein
VITSLQRILLIQEVSLNEFKFGVWCAVSATRIIGLIFLYIYSNRYVTSIVTLFITYPITREPTYLYLQGSSKIHTTTNHSIFSGLKSIPGDKKQEIVASTFVRSETVPFLLATYTEGENIQ